MSSHALLLRLFLSPSFFNVHVALQYLALYSSADHIGITYYIVRRLRELPAKDVHNVWDFVCHLLLTRPSSSRALESFVIQTAEQSTHVALLTLWIMQAALHDLSSRRVVASSDPSSPFAVCQRVLRACHELVFGDPPQRPAGPYGSASALASSSNPVLSFLRRRRRVKTQVVPALVGIGLVLGGTPALPTLTAVAGEMALEQGRIDDEGNDLRSLQQEDTIAGTSTSSIVDPEEEVDSPIPMDNGESSPSTPDSSIVPSSSLPSFNPSRTSPSLPLHILKFPRSRASIDPLGQMDAVTSMSASAAGPSHSSPSLPASALNRHRPSPAHSVDATLHRYDLPAQADLLRAHYCRSELRFLLALEAIANRLLVVPRPARVSALRAELTALNHALPAEVCMPLWCSSSDAPSPLGIPEPHHRIVRIPPGESVVLNSAERAPYVLMLEVLSGDLDFNPLKRANKDILKKIVSKELEKKGSSTGMTAFGKPTAIRTNTASVDHDTPLLEHDSVPPVACSVSFATPDATVAPTTPTEDEEVDLVEQLYGSARLGAATGADLSESIILPPAPKNRDLDRAAWLRSASNPTTPNLGQGDVFGDASGGLSLEEYSDRMRTAAVMLAQLNAGISEPVAIAGPAPVPSTAPKGPVHPSLRPGAGSASGKSKLSPAQAGVIRDRIMQEMLDLEKERMARMHESGVEALRTSRSAATARLGSAEATGKTAEDEGIIRRELDKSDPSAAVFSESWATKKARIRQASPYGHLASWDLFSCIVKTGGDLRQEQLATHLIQAFGQIWAEEGCQCWVRYFRILATSGGSGLVETITDAVSIHSIKKAEYGRRLAEGRLGHVTIMDHFKATYGDQSSAKFTRAQRNFAKSLAGYAVVTYLLQIKDRHNGNILLDRDGHLVHIDFGFMLSNSPGNIGFEAAPFKLPLEYVEVLGGVDNPAYGEFKTLFRDGFVAARKHCDRIITLVELMQKDSSFPCFAALGTQTSVQLRERFQTTLTHALVGEHCERLIESSVGSNWTRLYDSVRNFFVGLVAPS